VAIPASTCDDGNPCTVDSCNNTATTFPGCVHTPKVCPSPLISASPNHGNYPASVQSHVDLCKTPFCVAGSGNCSYTSVSCASTSANRNIKCGIVVCDPRYGCTTTASSACAAAIGSNGVALGGGAIAGIVIACAVVAAIIAVGGVAGYRAMTGSGGGMAGSNANPTYTPSANSGTSGIFKG